MHSKKQSSKLKVKERYLQTKTVKIYHCRPALKETAKTSFSYTQKIILDRRSEMQEVTKINDVVNIHVNINGTIF